MDHAPIRLDQQEPYDGRRLLRHGHPFRFIERFDALESGEAEARPRLPETWPGWASVFTRTSLPIEWAAQLYGARVRATVACEQPIGYLAGVKAFRWTEAPAPIVRVRVAPIAQYGGFHEFSADFFTRTGAGCAQLVGMLYLSSALMTPAPPAPISLADTDAALCALSSHAIAPFRMVADHTHDSQRTCRFEMDPMCPVYAGHFPGEPIAPGVLLLETMVEVGCALIEHTPPDQLYLMEVRDAVFQALIRPGDALLLSIRKCDGGNGIYRFTASFFCNNRRAIRAKFALRVLDNGTRPTEEAS